MLKLKTKNDDEKIDFSSIKKLKKYKKRNDAYSLYIVGLFYLNGICIPKNLLHSYEFFVKSYKLGYKEAQSYIALIQLSWVDEGFSPDFLTKSIPVYSIEDAYKNAKEAHINGFPDASKLLVRIAYRIEPNYFNQEYFKSAIDTAIDNKDSFSCSIALQLALNGNPTYLKKNCLDKTINYYMNKGAEESHFAHYMLSIHYYNQKDIKKHIHHLHKSAEKGNIDGNYHYGRFLYQTNEKEKAESHIRKAGLMGHTEACAFLGDVYQQENNINIIESINWYKRAIEKQHTPSMVALAALSFKNKQVSHIISKEEAKQLIIRASNMGNDFASNIVKYEKWI